MYVCMSVCVCRGGAMGGGDERECEAIVRKKEIYSLSLYVCMKHDAEKGIRCRYWHVHISYVPDFVKC